MTPTTAVILLAGAVAICLQFSTATATPSVKFQEVMDVIEEKRLELSQHKFFKFLSDESIPATKRIRFVPYWLYFALAAPDVLDNWMRIANPQTELEHRVNKFIDEDSFHYNLFLHDVENVLGYTPDRFGSLGGILRHIWGDDSRAVRMLIYSWASGVKKSKDPIVTLASFEAVEAGLKDFVETVYGKLFLGKDGFPGLKYFGQAHVDLEMNHTVTGWFKPDGEISDFTPIEEFDISEEAKAYSLEVVEDMFYWFDKTYDSLHNLCLAEDSIWPEKYLVDSYPRIHEFPEHHPNRKLNDNKNDTKDEL